MDQKYLAMGVSAFALIFAIVALATSGWVTVSTDIAGTSISFGFGLWETCSSVDDGDNSSSTCVDTELSSEACDGGAPCGEIEATRAFAIITVLAGAVSLTGLLVPGAAKFALPGHVFAAFSSLLAILIFGLGVQPEFCGDNDTSNCGPGYSMILEIVALLFYVAVSGVIFKSGGTDSGTV